MAEKSKQKIRLHKFIATGGKPKDYKGAVKNSVVRPTKK
jgi:hypothetical protein